MKKLRLDNTTRQIWWKGQLAKTTWEVQKKSDLEIKYGLDIECDVRHEVANSLAIEFNLSSTERRWLRFGLIYQKLEVTYE